jgi:hypothetical protein
MLSHLNPSGRRALWRLGAALFATAGAAGSVLAAGSGTYHTTGVAAVTIRTRLVAGNTYVASVLISHKEGVDVDVAIAATNLTVPATVTVPAGKTSQQFSVSPDLGLGNGTLTASLNGTSRSRSFTVVPIKVVDVALAPSQIIGGGARSKGSVLLADRNGGAMTIGLSTDDPRLVVPSSTDATAGSSRSAYFDVTAPAGVDNPVTANVIATVNSVDTSSPITILPASIRYAKLGNSGIVVGGRPVVVIVELTGRAGPSGKSYSVTSGNPSLIPNGTLVVAPGAKRGTLRLQTTDVTTQTNVSLTIPGQPAMGVTLKP